MGSVRDSSGSLNPTHLPTRRSRPLGYPGEVALGVFSRPQGRRADPARPETDDEESRAVVAHHRPFGRVIERVSGMSYEDYVRREVLIPAGAEGMRVADPFLEGRLENEVKYYDYPGASKAKSPRSQGTQAGAQALYRLPLDSGCGWWVGCLGG